MLHIMKAIILIIAFVTITLLIGCGAISDADEKIFFSHRDVSSLERQYAFLASTIDSPKPCFLIHPR